MNGSRKIEFILTVKSTQTRASIYHTIVKNNSNYNNNLSKDQKEFVFLPNYMIENNKILLKSEMPMQSETIAWAIKPETKYSKIMLDCEAKLEQKFNMCGKLLCIGFHKSHQDKMNISEGSFSIVKFHDDTVKAVSALHIVNKNPIREYDEYIFGSFRENISYHFSSDLLLKLEKVLPSNRERITEIRNYLAGENFYEFSITEGYFIRRKSFLKNIKNTQDESILLDPDYALQPQPSVDMVFLDLPGDLSEKIEKAELTPLKISERKDPKVGYLVAYHCTNYNIVQKSAEYCETEIPKDLAMGRLLNQCKSIGQCEIKSYTKNIVTYLATTGVGSSGGCILDEDGDIIAMNFGNYLDKEAKLKSSQKLESYDFKSTLEKKENLIQSKNTNLALNLKHDFIDFYFQQDSLKNQNKELHEDLLFQTENNKLLGHKCCREDV